MNGLIGEYRSGVATQAIADHDRLVMLDSAEMVALCDVTQLAEALQTITRIVPARALGSEAGTLLLRATATNLQLVVASMEVTEQLTVPAAVRQPTSFTVPARAFAEFVQLLPRGQVELRLSPSGLGIRSGIFNTVIRATAAELLSPASMAEVPTCAVVDTVAFLDAIERIRITRGLDDPRAVLHGVFMASSASEVILAATDAHRAAEERINLAEANVGNDPISVILPAKCVDELDHVFRAAADSLELSVSRGGNRLMFRGRDRVMDTTLIDGEFPGYDRVLPTGSATRLTADRLELLLALRGCNIFTMHGTNPVQLKVNGAVLVITGSSSELGDNSAQIAIEGNGPDRTVTVLGSYLLSVLSALSQDRVLLELRSQNTPVVVRPVDGPNYWCAIAPRITAMRT